MKKLWIGFLILSISVICYAQDFSGGFVDFGSNHATGIYTDTDGFSGPGILGASDITVQLALQTIDTSGATLITACQESDDFCFTFESHILILLYPQRH